jgi:hypothetical protein
MERMTEDKEVSLSHLYKVQQGHSIEIALLKQQGASQQKSLDEINNGVKHLVWIVLGALVLAVLRTLMKDGI